ncbi:MAG: TOBE-like domain-containing protein, partial [Hydrogenophaga sp.]|nr:TOBE-like domain-containing protein [Hydrogenophaga sp.]
RQRIALARALAVEPRVLLLDEPFGALDAKVRKELRRWLRRLHDELHVTSIFVTHDQEEALEVSDRVVLMNQGQVEQVGTPQDVWDHPASPFVYGFLGDVNLFHGRAHEGQVWLGGHLDGVSVHDVQRYQPGLSGIAADLQRAIVVGPIARLELLPVDANAPAGHDPLIEAQMSAERFRELGFQEGEKLVVSPKKARVFLQAAA